MTSTIAGVCAVRLLQFARALGVDASRLPTYDLPPGDMLEVRIPYGDLIKLWEDVMVVADDPGFPIACGATATAHDYDAVGFVCMTQPTLREAVKQCVRYARVWTDVSEWSFETTSESLTLGFICPDPDRLGIRYATENVLAEMMNAGRMLTNVDYPAAIVRFRHQPPADTSAHDRFFRSPIEWGAARNELVIAAEHGDLALPKADAALAAFFERHIHALLEKLTTDEPDRVSHRVRAFLIDEVRRGTPTLESAAASLAMSSRTLKRRLQDEGTTFQDLLDGVRCDLAKRYLDEQRVSLGEVAFLLGFSEPSAFHRAFKRWTGRTPLAYRQGSSAA